SHGPSQTTLPMIGASARSAHAAGRAAASGTSGAPADSFAVAPPGIVSPRRNFVARGKLSRLARMRGRRTRLFRELLHRIVGAAVVRLQGRDDAAAGGRARPPSNCLISTVDRVRASH